jgi:hypothetical protein
LLFGYFFGPVRDTVPTLDELQHLHPSDAVFAGRFGYLGLKGGTWPVIGRFARWERDQWAMPPLIRHQELTGRAYKAFYDDHDPSKVVRVEAAPPGTEVDGPSDDVMGDGFVELSLTWQLGFGDVVRPSATRPDRSQSSNTTAPDPFDDDAAEDWSIEVDESSPADRVLLIERSLRAVAECDGYLEQPVAAEGLAASAVLAYLRVGRGKLSLSGPGFLRRGEHLEASVELDSLAVRALDRIVGVDSEWREL